MRIHKILLAVFLLTGYAALSGQDIQTLPVKDFTRTMRLEGKFSDQITESESVMNFQGKALPCREFRMRYHQNNLLVLTMDLKETIDLRNVWHEL